MESAVVGFLILAAPVVVLLVAWRRNKAWQSWPTLEVYWQHFPNTRTPAGTRCYLCRSRNIHNHGWANESDNRRFHRCNQCDIGLYRTKV